jgi:hypothetical protein
MILFLITILLGIILLQLTLILFRLIKLNVIASHNLKYIF